MSLFCWSSIHRFLFCCLFFWYHIQYISWIWWCMPILGRLRQERLEFKDQSPHGVYSGSQVRVDYIARFYFWKRRKVGEMTQRLRAHCCCGRLELGSQRPHGRSQPSVTCSRGSDLFWPPRALYALGAHPYPQAHTQNTVDEYFLKKKRKNSPILNLFSVCLFLSFIASDLFCTWNSVRIQLYFLAYGYLVFPRQCCGNNCTAPLDDCGVLVRNHLPICVRVCFWIILFYCSIHPFSCLYASVSLW